MPLHADSRAHPGLELGGVIASVSKPGYTSGGFNQLGDRDDVAERRDLVHDGRQRIARLIYRGRPHALKLVRRRRQRTLPQVSVDLGRRHGARRVVHPDEEDPLFLAGLGPGRLGAHRDVDAADLVTTVLDDPSAGAHNWGVTERIDQVRGQPVDEAVAVPRLDARVVVLQPEDRTGVVHTDQQRPALGVEEPGDRLDHCVLHGLVGLALAQVPSRGRLELDGEVLVVGDDLLDRPQDRAALQAELGGDAGRKLGVGTDGLHEAVGDRPDVDLGQRRDTGAAGHRLDRLAPVNARPVVPVSGSHVVEDGLDFLVEDIGRLGVVG